jgi:hypothetical protein
MSSAFVKEGDNEKLNEVGPALYDLLSYLRRENGGTRIYETKVYYDIKRNRDVYEMSDGLTYALNDDKQWYIILD